MVSCSESEWQRFGLFTGQSTVNFFLRSVGHFPEASLVGSHLLKSKVCQGDANLRGEVVAQMGRQDVEHEGLVVTVICYMKRMRQPLMKCLQLHLGWKMPLRKTWQQ